MKGSFGGRWMRPIPLDALRNPYGLFAVVGSDGVMIGDYKPTIFSAMQEARRINSSGYRCQIMQYSRPKSDDGNSLPF
jgi:hypothetical protein